ISQNLPSGIPEIEAVSSDASKDSTLRLYKPLAKQEMSSYTPRLLDGLQKTQNVELWMFLSEIIQEIHEMSNHAKAVGILDKILQYMTSIANREDPRNAQINDKDCVMKEIEVVNALRAYCEETTPETNRYKLLVEACTSALSALWGNPAIVWNLETCREPELDFTIKARQECVDKPDALACLPEPLDY
ncbi:hypothetical protein V5O48_018809, partial [Marasmius crinis-equi]